MSKKLPLNRPAQCAGQQQPASYHVRSLLWFLCERRVVYRVNILHQLYSFIITRVRILIDPSRAGWFKKYILRLLIYDDLSVQVFRLILNSSVGLWVGIQSAGELVSETSQLRSIRKSLACTRASKLTRNIYIYIYEVMAKYEPCP